MSNFTDGRGITYTFDGTIHCGSRGIGAFCIVGPGHCGEHWDGERAWPQATTVAVEAGV